MLVAACYGRNTFGTFVAPAGWTELTDLRTDCGNGITQFVFWKEVGSEPASYDFTYTSGVGRTIMIASLSGVDIQAPFDDQFTLGGECPGSIYRPNPVTSNGNGRVVLSFYAQELDQDVSPPSGYVVPIDTSIPEMAFGFAYKLIDAGVEEPGWVRIGSNNDGVACTILLRGLKL
jgi:hypothetical protein